MTKTKKKAQHNMQTGHLLDFENDRCACGGMVVYWEDPDRDGYVGEGCEVGGVFANLREFARCDLCGERLNGKGVRMHDPKVWEQNPLAYSPSYHVHKRCGKEEGYEEVTR